MKKLSTHRRAWSIRLTARRTERRLRRRRLLRVRNRPPAAPRTVSNVTDAPELVAAPRIFGIENKDSRSDLVRFLKKLREWAVLKGRHVKIDFSATKQMQMAGTLLFAAELDRINTLTSKPRISCDYPPDQLVAQVLQHVGIFDMLGQNRRLKVTHETVRYWKIASGHSADGERASQAIEAYEDRFSKPDQKALYRALTEAMTNCRHHAYPDDEKERAAGHWWIAQTGLRRWWMFSQLKDNRLSVGLCDLGVGIPRSLRIDKAGLLGLILGIIGGLRLLPNDANLIRGAMALGATRTKQEHRGKGLMDMRSVLDGLKGTLQIHSGRGFYGYRAAEAREQCTNFRRSMSIGGTVVLWEIPVTQQASDA
jgi:hypothetical protein